MDSCNTPSRRSRSISARTTLPVNKGKAHYIVINVTTSMNRDYQYIGYVDESILVWMEQDLKYVPADHLVFVIAHIQISTEK
ncbi:MAG: hypothetical protein ACLUVY_05570 [Bacteroides uniformis]